MKPWTRVRVATVVAALVGGWALVMGGGCALFQSEEVAKGQQLYAHYCMHCHGENGRQNEGFNWASMPDPRPKDLANKAEMGTFTDEEIFHTISRDMKDTSPGGDKIGDDEFAVPTMPTFKYTLSEEEIWSLVAFVRTLHGKKLEFDIVGRKKQLEESLAGAKQTYEQATKAYEEAERKAEEAAEQKGTEVDDTAYEQEMIAMGEAKKELDQAEAALTYFTTRPGKGASVARPDLTMPADAQAKLTEKGKRLYSAKYGCNGCHKVGDAGGKVGPALDRAGFRLNGTWIYRWVRNPQAMKSDTRMPNLGLNDEDAKAVTMYVKTLRAPKPDRPIEKPVED